MRFRFLHIVTYYLFLVTFLCLRLFSIVFRTSELDNSFLSVQKIKSDQFKINQGEMFTFPTSRINTNPSLVRSANTFGDPLSFGYFKLSRREALLSLQSEQINAKSRAASDFANAKSETKDWLTAQNDTEWKLNILEGVTVAIKGGNSC